MPIFIDRQTGAWLYYNFAAGSFHTKKPCSRLYSIEIEFYLKNKRIAFWGTLGELRGNVCTPSIARFKARGQIHICYVELSRHLLRLRRYKRKSVKVGVFWRGWVTLSANFRQKGASPTNHCWCQKTRVIAFCAVSKCLQCIVWFCKKACMSHMDGQKYDSQDCAVIAASCGKNRVYQHCGWFVFCE